MYMSCVFVVLHELREERSYEQIRKIDPEFKLADGLWEFSPLILSKHGANIVNYSYLALTGFRFFLITGPKPTRWTLSRRIMLCLGLMYFLRGLFLLTTSLPQTYSKFGLEYLNSRDSVTYNAFLILIQQPLMHSGFCFSGHCMTMTTCLFVWWEYAPKSPLTFLGAGCYKENCCTEALFYVTCIFHVGVLIIFLVFTRFQYTLDMLISLFVSYSILVMYHFAISNMTLTETWMNDFLMWFESDAEDLYLEHKKQEAMHEIHQDFHKKKNKIIDSHLQI